VKRIVGAALAGLLVLGMSGSSSAIPPLDDLPRGPDTVIPHLVDGAPPVIKAPGVEIPLPTAVTTDNDYFALVGRTDLGWLVLASRGDGEGGTERDSLHMVTTTASTRLLEFGHYFGFPHYRLSTSRKRIIRYPTGGDIVQYLTVYDLQGHLLAKRKADDVLVWDFTGTRVLYGNRSWRLGERPRVLTSLRVEFADIGNNTLVVKEKVGPRRAVASLTHPGRFRWRAYFHPRMISPDGTRIAGWGTTQRGKFRGILQVRRMSDGRLLTSIDASAALFAPYVMIDGPVMRWEGNAAVVFPGTYDNSSGPDVLVKCTMTKVCSRVSDPANRFSFAPRPGLGL
jgi:hypothetical protein